VKLEKKFERGVSWVDMLGTALLVAGLGVVSTGGLSERAKLEGVLGAF
jgi:hypothetical protein